MTTAAIGPPRPRSFGLLGSWLSVRHSLRVEAAAALTLYGLYELTRDLVVSDSAQADAHAHRLVALERSLHLFVESNVQRAVQTLPGLTSLLGVAYLTLHLTVTAGVLLWLHRRRPEGFAFARTALLLASALSLVGFLVYPTAPPGWSASASSTPSPAAGTSTSTAASSARCTTRTPPCRACTSATRSSSPPLCSTTVDTCSSARSERSTRRSWCSSPSPPATISSSTPPRARSSPGSAPRSQPS
jgi:hypothetical protein